MYTQAAWREVGLNARQTMKRFGQRSIRSARVVFFFHICIYMEYAQDVKVSK